VPDVVKRKRVKKQNIRRMGFWRERDNRRKFLIDLATSKGLDPFTPSTWYKLTPGDVKEAKVDLVSY
jgi:hypothetical protein